MEKKEYQVPEVRIFVFGSSALVQAWGVDDGQGNVIPSFGGDGEFTGEGGWNDFPWLTT